MNEQIKVMIITHHFRRIYRIYLKLIKKNWKIKTCNRLDLEHYDLDRLCTQNFPDIGHSSQILQHVHFGSYSHLKNNVYWSKQTPSDYHFDIDYPCSKKPPGV